MQKNIIYSIIFTILAIFLLFVVFDGDDEQNAINTFDDNEEDTVFIEDKNDKIRQNINIKYSKSAKKQERKKVSNNNAQKTKEMTQSMDEENNEVPSGEKEYSVSTATTKVGRFTFNISSSARIAKSNPDAFPMLPAFIKGKIDGVSYSVVIPVDLKNKDLKISIANEETGETKELPFAINELKSGSNVEIDIDYDNIDNFHIKKESSIVGPPVPPGPPPTKKLPPRLPGQS